MGYADAVDILRRMTGIPADRLAALARLSQEIPKSFAFSRRAGNWPQTCTIRCWLGEAVNTVEVCSFAGRNRSPKDGGQHRLQGEQVPHDAVLDQSPQVWHSPTIEQWVDQLPIRGVPADEEQFFRDWCSHAVAGIDVSCPSLSASISMQ